MQRTAKKMIHITTKKHEELIDITCLVNEEIERSGIMDGIAVVFVHHATAALVINENDDPNVCTDFLRRICQLIPDKAGYLHDRIDGNAAAHLKAALLGPDLTIPVKDGGLHLGRWQAVMLAEFDGPRERNISVSTF